MDRFEVVSHIQKKSPLQLQSTRSSVDTMPTARYKLGQEHLPTETSGAALTCQRLLLPISYCFGDVRVRCEKCQIVLRSDIVQRTRSRRTACRKRLRCIDSNVHTCLE